MDSPTRVATLCAMHATDRRSEIASLLAYRDQHGLTYAELSAECGIPVSTLAWWKRRLHEDPTTFAEVVVDDVGPTTEPAPLLLRVEGLVIEIPDGFSADTVAVA